jgi:hypothetical protein
MKKARRQRKGSVLRTPELVYNSINNLMYNNCYTPEPKVRQEKLKANKFDSVWEQLKAEVKQLNPTT